VPHHYLQTLESFDYCSDKDVDVGHGARIQSHDMADAHIKARIVDEPYLDYKDVTIDHDHPP
jgi:hypothetical protein